MDVRENFSGSHAYRSNGKGADATAIQQGVAFLQLHTFYDEYLESFYGTHPEAQIESFDNQIKALIADGFGANHMFAAHLPKIGINSRLIVVNSKRSQLQWLKENGIRIELTQDWVKEIARLQIEFYKPTVLYTADPIRFDTQFLNSLNWKPELVVGWRAAPIPESIDWSGYDLMLSHLSDCRRVASKHGAKNVEHFSPGLPDFIAESVKNEPKSYDVVFTGQCTPYHKKRNRLIDILAQQASSPYSFFSLKLFLYTPHSELPSHVQQFNSGAVWGLDMHKVLKRAKIVVNAEIDMAQGEAGNMRLFEVTGTGSFLLTEHHENIQEYFEPGVEIETFRNETELLEKIRFYLANPDKREEIARRGQERSLKGHSMMNQCKQLVSILNKYRTRGKFQMKSEGSSIGNDTVSVPKSAEEIVMHVRKGIELLNSNLSKDALELFKALSALSDLPIVHHALATAYIRNGDVKTAVSTLESLISRNPDYSPAHELISLIRPSPIASTEVQRGHTSQARVLVEEAARALFGGDPVVGMRKAEQACAMGETIPGMHFIRSRCLNAVGRHEEALQAAKEELICNPQHNEARVEVERLSNALRKRVLPRIPFSERSFHTALPHDVVMSIQGAAHNYVYKGIPMIKNPFDYALYPMLLWNLRPKTIIEIGSKQGGSAVWLGDMINNFNLEAKVYSVDIVGVKDVAHPNVIFLEGNGRDLAGTFTPEFLKNISRPLLVIEDADHSYETSIAVLNFFDKHLRTGEYIVVEDGIISDMDKDPDCNSGPHKAIKAFMSERMNDYSIDEQYNDFFGYNYTWCTNGFLKRN